MFCLILEFTIWLRLIRCSVAGSRRDHIAQKVVNLKGQQNHEEAEQILHLD
jgi:hypothetical protein